MPEYVIERIVRKLRGMSSVRMAATSRTLRRVSLRVAYERYRKIRGAIWALDTLDVSTAKELVKRNLPLGFGAFYISRSKQDIGAIWSTFWDSFQNWPRDGWVGNMVCYLGRTGPWGLDRGCPAGSAVRMITNMGEYDALASILRRLPLRVTLCSIAQLRSEGLIMRILSERVEDSTIGPAGPTGSTEDYTVDGPWPSLLSHLLSSKYWYAGEIALSILASKLGPAELSAVIARSFYGYADRSCDSVRFLIGSAVCISPSTSTPGNVEMGDVRKYWEMDKKLWGEVYTLPSSLVSKVMQCHDWLAAHHRMRHYIPLGEGMILSSCVGTFLVDWSLVGEVHRMVTSMEYRKKPAFENGVRVSYSDLDPFPIIIPHSPENRSGSS